MSLNEKAESYLWVEKYRPANIADIIMPARLREECEGYVNDKQIPHMLLAGSAGIGKTTVARALINMIDADMLYINASNESGVDTIRTKIVQFASTASFEGNLKVVLLDECLHEDERVRVGTVDSWVPVALKDLELNKKYEIVSLNQETGQLENDIGYIISDREDEVFEVELEDGRIIRANAKHPFFVLVDGKIVEKELGQLQPADMIVSIK